MVEPFTAYKAGDWVIIEDTEETRPYPCVDKQAVVKDATPNGIMVTTNEDGEPCDWWWQDPYSIAPAKSTEVKLTGKGVKPGFRTQRELERDLLIADAAIAKLKAENSRLEVERERLETELNDLRAAASDLDSLDMGDAYTVKAEPYERLMVLVDPALKSYYGRK